MTTTLTNRYYQTLAGVLDGVVLRSHARVARRHQNVIQPRLPQFIKSDPENIARLFPSPPTMPLEYIRGDVWERRAGLWRRDFTFPSFLSSAHANNNHAIIQTYAPDRALHFPAVIVLHGLMTLTLLPYRPFFRAIVEAGASAYALELPYHLRRAPASCVSGELFFTADLEMSLAAIQQTVAEARQLIHYLRAAGAPTIGLLGFSLGAWMSGLIASCEPEVDFALFAIPPSNLNGVLWQTKLGEPLRRQFEAAGWSVADTAPFYHLLDPQHLSLLLPPERREIFAAEFDRFIPFQYTQQLQRHWQLPQLHVYRAGHIGMLWSRKFLRDVGLTVAQQLRLGRRQETPVTVVPKEAMRALPRNAPQQNSPSEALPQFAAEK
jgi:hypothetical protein